MLCLTIAARPAFADITIEIDRGYDNPRKVAVVPFDVERSVRDIDDIADIVAFDLARSGQFAPLDPGNMLSFPTEPDDVLFRDWRVLGVEYVVIGRARQQPDGRLAVTFHLFNVYNEQQMLSDTVIAPLAQTRDIAHYISDEVYEKLTNIRGAFSTKIAYVLAQNLGTDNPRFKLQIADSDGARARTLLDSPEPILSASWSPDGERLAYLSFELGKASIFLHDIATDNRQLLTNFPGLNSAPAFSPDGREIAVVLSRDGNAEIYVIDLATTQMRRVTRHPGIDTEPVFTPDGEHVVFTSNRAGSPQIYQVELATGLTERLTFRGDYNAGPELLANGNQLVFVHRDDNGTFHIALEDLARDRLYVLTETSLDESPSVSPNGVMLIYATQENGRGILSVVSIDGRVKYRLPSSEGDVREPAWSPYLDPVVTSVGS